LTAARLRIHLSLLPHPYPQDPGAWLESWGRFVFAVERGREIVTLVDSQWNLDALAEWFVESEVALRAEELCIAGYGPLPQESLAQAEHRLRDRDFADGDPEEAPWFEALFAYWEQHNLYVPFRGSRHVPSMYIGLNKGVGEVSRYDPDHDIAWAYPFDMAAFCATLRQELVALLRAWQRDAPDAQARARAVFLLSSLLGQTGI